MRCEPDLCADPAGLLRWCATWQMGLGFCLKQVAIKATLASESDMILHLNMDQCTTWQCTAAVNGLMSHSDGVKHVAESWKHIQ